MITFKEAQVIINGLAQSFGTELVPLKNATGAILAESVVADRDYPPFNRATMDGYAMKFEDVSNGLLKFHVVETIFAGQLPTQELKSHQCYKIMTGAPVPASADMMIQREHVVDVDGIITIQAGQYKEYQQIAKKGEDAKKHTPVINAPVVCTPAVISALAALGKATVAVQKLPRVSIFTTGNEVVEVGEPVADFQIRNSNLYMFRALLKTWGIEPFICEHIKDDKAALMEILAKGLKGDIVLISGGVSAGDADYVPEVLDSLGVSKLFHKVNIKPGKPLWCGAMPGGAIVFALPGNPFSGLVTFTLFVESYLSHCLTSSDAPTITLPLDGERIKRSQLDEFFPVSVNYSTLTAAPASFNGSGDILAAIHADGIAHHPADTAAITSGSKVTVRLFRKH